MKKGEKDEGIRALYAGLEQRDGGFKQRGNYFSVATSSCGESDKKR